MNTKEYEIILKTEESNGFFQIDIRWNVRAIAGQSQSGNGYIVQYITRNTEGTESFIEEHKEEKAYFDRYYEAWPVKDYCIILPDKGYDDSWIYGGEYESRRYDIQRKHQTKCCMTMTGTVYWVEEGTKHYETVERDFHVVPNSAANELICSVTFEGVEELCPVCERKEFAKWDYTDEEYYQNELIKHQQVGDEEKRKEHIQDSKNRTLEKMCAQAKRHSKNNDEKTKV